VFGIGPAGTGKTYLAVAMAVSALLSKKVSRIILTRPAVEAGERLGFLPGTFQEKVDPYLRPLYDALFDMLEVEKVEKLLERNVIEVAPIAFMRGRTLNDSFIIMDEAQNTTTEQMFMLLTRMGPNSKCVVTGDVTQIDLPNARRSGLLEAAEVLKHVEGPTFASWIMWHHRIARQHRGVLMQSNLQTAVQTGITEENQRVGQIFEIRPGLRLDHYLLSRLAGLHCMHDCRSRAGDMSLYTLPGNDAPSQLVALENTA